ncbi:MAG: YfhO family protein [Acidobacteria bacterium]|nr:YfhO family protein [Acidobacteriota bacterium]MBV9478065.1 YfhO family protein [Acidobacteriota bacterium]
MPLLLHSLAALALVGLAHRFVRPLSRGAALVLFALPFVIAGYALLTSRVLAPVDLAYQTVPLNWMKETYGVSDVSTGLHSDVLSQFIPWRAAVRDSLARGEWGLWNRYAFAGDILLAGEQPAVFSPITLLACLLPAALSFTFTGALTLFIAALCAFLLARELDCGEPAALVAAASWSLATSLVVFVLVPLGATWAWAPLLFVSVQRLVRAPRIASAALLAFTFTALLAAAHLESVLLIVALGVAYALLELARRPSVRAVALAAGAGVVALLVSAVHLLPFFEALPWTMEYATRDLFRDSARGVPLPDAALRMLMTFFPYLNGRPPVTSFMNGAIGSIATALALYALWRVRSRATWFFGATFLACLVIASEWRPVATLLGRVPLFDIAIFDRMAFGAALSLAVLAALGAEALARRGGDRAAGATLAAWFVVVAAGNYALLHAASVPRGPVKFGEHVVAAELVPLAFAAALLFRKRAALPALLALIIVQRWLAVSDAQKSFPRRAAYPPIPILEPLRAIRTPFRIVGHGNALIPGTATLYGLEDARGYSAMTLLRYRETYGLWCVEQPVWFNRVDDLSRPFLSFLNVRYAITWDRAVPPPGWTEVARQRGAILLENHNALDRAFVPRGVHVGASTNVTLMEMALATDFADRAWIEANVPAPYDSANGPGRLTIANARLGYAIDADMQNDGWIVTSIAAWPGWRAYVDGRRVDTNIANHAFVSVRVPRGHHRVALRYFPDGFAVGRTISAVTLALIVLASLLFHRRKPLLEAGDAAVAALPLGE